jgi:hypothetical protein
VLRGLVAALTLLLALAAFTFWALESSGVAVVSTRTPDGGERDTHVWFVEQDGELWLEAGTPENPWYKDSLLDPALRIARDGQPARTYSAVPTPERSREVRAQLRAKYGIRDRWVGLFVDSSRSVAVRLEPRP